MKRCVSILILLWLLTVGYGEQARAEEVSLVADEWCPYNCIPDSEYPGFMVEICQAVLGEAGITVKYSILPWSRGVNEIEQGRYQGAIATLPSELPDMIYPRAEQGFSIMVMLAKKGTTWRYDGVPSLAGRRIAVVKDYYYGDAIDEYITRYRENSNLVQVTAGDRPLLQNLKLLEWDRVDAVIVDRDVYRHHAHLNNLKDRFIEIGVVDAAALFVAFAPDQAGSQKYADMLTKGMPRLRASGQLARILARYGLVDWKQ